jgi:PAS domain S-box-containing protein
MSSTTSEGAAGAPGEAPRPRTEPRPASEAAPIEERLAQALKRLAEAEETLAAIQAGEVDAVVVPGPSGEHQVFTLEGTERPYRLIVEAMNEGAAILLEDGTILYGNGRLAEMVGCARDQLTGFGLSRFVPPSQLPTFEALLRAGAGGAAKGEIQLGGGQGGRDPYPVFVSVSSIRAHEVPGLCLVVTDLSEQKRAQDIIAAEDFARSVLDQAAEAIVVCDSTGRVIRASREAHRLCTANPLFKRLDEAFRFVAAATLLVAVLRGQTLRGVEMTLERAGSGAAATERNLLVSAGPLHHADRSLAGSVITMTDITERKRSEAALRESEEQLRQAQKMEAIGRLAGGVAHDFNNLLTVIEGQCYRLLKRLGPADPSHTEVSEIRRAAERATVLTRQLLTFSRKQVVQPTVLDPNVVVAGMEPMLRRLIGETVELACDLGATVGCVKADTGQLEQVVLNLALNARDAMPQGGRLCILTRNVTDGLVEWRGREPEQERELALPDAPPGRHVLIAVRDTGVGMDEQTKAHLFEPFFTTKEKCHGTGLGLATVYGVVSQSGGRIAFASDRGKGTEFRIYLPRVELRAPAAPPPPASRERERRAATILLVEDEDAVRLLTAHILREQGFDVLVAENGADALAVSARHPGTVDLVLTDVVMPRMSGRELADRLVETRPKARILFMSGYTHEKIAEHGVLEPGVAFIHKPFAPDVLERRIRDMLDASAATCS